jgi:exodeoxyribonuclease-3
MKIICWNVNGLRANVKKGGFDWFLQQSPDIYCIQETKSHPEQLEEGVRNPSGYHSYFDHSKGKKGYSGVAIYTKVKPLEVDYSLGSDHEFDQEGRFISLIYEGESLGLGKSFGKLAVINIYFPNGGGGPVRLDYKLRFYDAFLEYTNRLHKKGIEIVFCGDVNTAHHEIDLARPKENEKNTGFLPEERAWLDQVVSSGYVDVFRHFYPTKIGAYTYWDMKTFARERNVGWRIDYFFVTPKVLKEVNTMKILSNVMGSDHCPILLEIKQ